MFILIVVVALCVSAIAATFVLVRNDGQVAVSARMWESTLEAPAAREAAIARFA